MRRIAKSGLRIASIKMDQLVKTKRLLSGVTMLLLVVGVVALIRAIHTIGLIKLSDEMSRGMTFIFDLISFCAVLLIARAILDLVLRTTEIVALTSKQNQATTQLAEFIDRHLLPALDRIGTALERPPTAPTVDPRTMAIDEARQAIKESRWLHADLLLDQLEETSPEAPEIGPLRAAVNKGKATAVGSLKARLNAAREASDTEGVIAYRDELMRYLPDTSRTELDREVLKWLMLVIQRRMRTGSVRADVAHLAANVAERFAETVEGASLRAALPTLRRSAGLCPRCAQPYAGIDDTCPDCLAALATQSVADPGPAAIRPVAGSIGPGQVDRPSVIPQSPKFPAPPT